MSDPRMGATSASSAEADSLCPGRFQAQRGLPEIKSEDAASGTRIHEALAGKVIQLSPDEQEIKERCEEIEQKLVAQVFGAEKPKKVFVEQRFWCKIPVPQGEALLHSGQADKVHRAINKALVVDYKTGSGDQIESPKNMQLRDLAVLVSGGLVVNEIYTAIVQPMATMNPELCVYNQGDLDIAKAQMFNRVRASRAPNAKRIPGPKQCRWCRATSTCPEHNAWAGSLVPVSKSILDVAISEWTPQQCAVFCAGRAAARRWLDDAEEAIKARLAASSDAVPGWKLKEGKRRRAVNDPTQLFQRFVSAGGKQDDFIKSVKIGIDDLKLQLREATKLKGVALNNKLNELLEGVIEIKQDEPSLAKADE